MQSDNTDNTRHVAPQNAPVPGTYRHYKGGMYQVLGMARNSETDEWMVVYQALYADYGFWLRPLAIWLEPVNKNSAVVMRFELIEETAKSLNQLSKKTQEHTR